ncbi:MAG TPA: TetR/AcrR family transcriptional regulator [Abditibacterium sp.]
MASNKREQILRAAGAVVMEWGAEKMTLDAVAEQAGVSKGGLLYHFPSKEALIEAMVARLIEEFGAEVQNQEQRLASQNVPAAGRWLRAYVTVGTTPEQDFDVMMAALLAAVTSNPALLGTMREADARWQNRAENDGIDPQLATVIRLAADGCWMSALFGFEAGFESEAKLRAVQKTLLRLIDRAIAESEEVEK